jgi:hypothetical protein
VTPPIRDWIALDPTCEALLRHDGLLRVTLNEVPQDKAGQPFLPAVVYQVVTGISFKTLGCRPTIDSYRLQLDAYATDQHTAQAVFEAVRNVLEGYGYVDQSFTERDPDTRNWRISFDFSSWQHRQ